MNAQLLGLLKLHCVLLATRAYLFGHKLGSCCHGGCAAHYPK